MILLPYLHLGLENGMAIQDVRPCCLRCLYSKAATRA